jgi:hypothetical protein
MVGWGGGEGMSGRDTEEITVEVGRRAKDLAWEFRETPEEVAEQCLRYGLRNYEQALGVGRDG